MKSQLLVGLCVALALPLDAFQPHQRLISRSTTQRFQRRNDRQYTKRDRPSHRIPFDDDDDFFYDDTPSPTATRDRVVYDSERDQPEEDEKSSFFSQKTLASFSNNNPLFRKLCRDAGITRPSKIQSLTWPVLMKGKSAIVADQTGSGKTLAYLLPLLQRCQRAGSPSMIVLAPTAELADQIKAVCDKLTVSSAVLTATGQYATGIRDQIRMLKQKKRYDVLISTPGRIATILRTRQSGLDLSQVQAVVLDEVDVLLVDETFGPQLRTLGAALQTSPQFVFVTATLPNSVVETVQREFPDVQVVKGPGLHRVALTVQERLVDVSVPPQFNRDAKYCFEVKAKELLAALRQTRCRRTLIFCNTVESCRQVENLLHRRDRGQRVYRAHSYHGAMTPEARRENLQAFCANHHSDDNVDSVLICTDRAARGVDFAAAPVDHVVLFDFPKDPAEYVRRVGRTARAGRQGTSTVLAYGWQLPIARNIMQNSQRKLGDVEGVYGEDDQGDWDDYDNGSVEFRGGVQRRLAKSKKGTEDASIKSHIARGKLWG